MKTTEITNLLQFLETVSDLFEKWQPSKVLFFRGLSDARYTQLPSVFRDDHPESEFSHGFRASAAIRERPPHHDDLDRWLFLMQHHRLPTRLLDWSESPLVALHFALHRNNTPCDAAVCILEPTGLNKLVLGKRYFPDRNDANYRYRFSKAFYKNPSDLPWQSGGTYDNLNRKGLPLAIRPVFVHERMISQKAAFTIHGDDSRCVEEIFAEHGMDALLQRFLIPAKSKQIMERDLKRIGITRSVVFPDLEGIAEDLVSRSNKGMAAS